MNFVNKGFIFVGCSFTWGYGLGYYFKKGNNDIFNEDKYIDYIDTISLVQPKSYLLYQYSKRFSDLVSNHFKTFKIQPEIVSGSDIVSTSFINKILKRDGSMCEFNKEIDLSKLNIKDFSVCIFQTSYVNRNAEFFWDKLIDKSGNLLTSLEECNKAMENEAMNSGNHFLNQITKLTWEAVKETSMCLEQNGVKVFFIHAENEYETLDDSYLKERTIPIEYNNKQNFSIQDITIKYPEKLICFDHDYFGKNTPNDFHPSLELHEIISKSIIKRLENE